MSRRGPAGRSRRRRWPGRAPGRRRRGPRCRDRCRRPGRRWRSAPCPACPCPWKPVSVAPTESVKIASGKTAIHRFFTSGLKIAALLEMRNRLETSYGVPVAAFRSNSSISGRAMASPVMKISWTLSRSMISQVRCGSNFGSRTVRWPANRCISSPACAPPCMSGLSGKVVIRGLGGLLRLRELLQRLTGVEVDAAAEHPPEVLVAPHDALGEAGGAAGVDDVDVVGAALTEVALGALARVRLLERDAPEGRDVVGIVRVRHVRERHERLQLGVLGGALGHQVGVGALEEQRHDVGVVEEVVELALDVAVVDVDGRRAQLDGRQDGHHVLDGVLRVDRDVVARLDPCERPGSAPACCCPAPGRHTSRPGLRPSGRGCPGRRRRRARRGRRCSEPRAQD